MEVKTGFYFVFSKDFLSTSCRCCVAKLADSGFELKLSSSRSVALFSLSGYLVILGNSLLNTLNMSELN